MMQPRTTFLCLLGLLLACTAVRAAPQSTETPFMLISEDGANSAQRIIRINPLDLPPIKYAPRDNAPESESSLIKIQTLLPSERRYVNSNSLRRSRPTSPDNETKQSNIVRIAEPKPHKLHPHQPKHKQLHFIYDVIGGDNEPITKTLPVHVAPGAYPVYYVVSRSNGRFGKYPIKGFRDEPEFQKYLLKRKLQTVEILKPDENLKAMEILQPVETLQPTELLKPAETQQAVEALKTLEPDQI